MNFLLLCDCRHTFFSTALDLWQCFINCSYSSLTPLQATTTTTVRTGSIVSFHPMRQARETLFFICVSAEDEENNLSVTKFLKKVRQEFVNSMPAVKRKFKDLFGNICTIYVELKDNTISFASLSARSVGKNRIILILPLVFKQSLWLCLQTQK